MIMLIGISRLLFSVIYRLIALIATLGRSGYLLFWVVFSIFRMNKTKHWPLLIKQLYNIGVLSLLFITISGLFIGIILGIEGYLVLAVFNAESNLGMIVTMSLLRELGPVVTALLFAGRVGSTLTAEIGLMKATEQISSLEMMGVDPIQRVIAPRFLADLISMPLLTAIFVSVGILGGALVGIDWKGIDECFFWSSIQSIVDLKKDIIFCFIKSIIFAFTIGWIALFNGYDSVPTSEGISRATTRTVVYSSLAVLSLDFVLTALVFGN